MTLLSKFGVTRSSCSIWSKSSPIPGQHQARSLVNINLHHWSISSPISRSISSPISGQHQDPSQLNGVRPLEPSLCFIVIIITIIIIITVIHYSWKSSRLEVIKFGRNHVLRSSNLEVIRFGGHHGWRSSRLELIAIGCHHS